MEKYEEIERAIIKTYRKCIWRKFIKGINSCQMMNEGDRIAVCVSGSAKSMLLAKCAQEIQRHGVFSFELEFITADAAMSEKEKRLTEKNAALLNIPLTLFEAADASVQTLTEKARSMDCNKIALGQCFDDATETILSSLLLKGEIRALLPKERGGENTEIIRPLYMIKEKDINAWANRCETAFVTDVSKNTEIKELIKGFRRVNPYIEKNIFKSVYEVNLSTLIGYHKDDMSYNFLDDYDERG